MTAWHDQQPRGASGTAVDPSRGADGRAPMSRREAREAERRAAEAREQQQSHPSGVVDFDGPGFGPEYGPDQEFSVGDTTDIWAALQRRTDEPAPAPTPAADELAQFRTGVPAAPAAPAQGDSGAMSAELLERIREAVLRREREEQQPAAEPERVPTRRELRQRETSDLRDDLPAGALLPQQDDEPDAAPFRLGGYPEPFGRTAPEQDAYDPTRPGYYDEPYAPEPTAIVPVLPAEQAEAFPPDVFAAPAGDDALTFSSPAHHAPGAPPAPHAEADLEFLEPRDPWADARERAAAARAAEPAPAAEVPAAFQNPALGPPSEVTDLAGFEALIRKARAQQPAPQPVVVNRDAPVKKFAWADEDEAQDGFTGLIGRGVQGGNGSSNALMLPNDPQPDVMQAVNSTGDIFVTGSMNLSRRLSTTGAVHDQDEAEIDRLYEVSQDEPAAGVAPVRASRAVSGTGANRSIVSTRRTRGSVLPTVLAIVAGAMAVGVVTLLIGSWVLKIF